MMHGPMNVKVCDGVCNKW